MSVKDNNLFQHLLFLGAVLGGVMLSGFSCAAREAAVRKEGEQRYLFCRGGRYGFIARDGSVAIPARYSWAYGFTEGLAAVCEEKTGLFGFIDVSGKMVISPSFSCVGCFSEGLAWACPPDRDDWGVIDRTGAWVAQPKFEEIGTFKEGIAQAKLGDRTHVIDSRGCSIFIGQEQGILSTTSEGMMCVRVGGLWGYIDTSGKLALPAVYDLAGPFSDGLARVLFEGQQAFIDHAGKIVFRPEARIQVLLGLKDALVDASWKRGQSGELTDQ